MIEGSNYLKKDKRILFVNVSLTVNAHHPLQGMCYLSSTLHTGNLQPLLIYIKLLQFPCAQLELLCLPKYGLVLNLKQRVFLFPPSLYIYKWAQYANLQKQTVIIQDVHYTFVPGANSVFTA